MNLLNEKDILDDIKSTKKEYDWVMKDDPDAFRSINALQASLTMDKNLLELIKSKGVVQSYGVAIFFKDEQGNLYKSKPVHTPYASDLVILKNGKKAWLKKSVKDGTEDTENEEYTFEKLAKKYGLHQVVVDDLPVFYRLSGDDFGHAWPTCYESPVNHVTGEKSKYWNM